MTAAPLPPPMQSYGSTGATPTSAVQPAVTPPRDLLTMLVIAVIVVMALYVGRDIILPIVLAVILAFVLTPIVNLLRRIRIGRAPAVVITVVSALALMTTLAFVVASQVSQLAADLPRYEVTMQQKAASFQEGVLGRISKMAGHLGRQFERASETQPSPEEAATETAPRPMPVEIHAPDPSPLQLAQRFILPALHPLATFAITFVVLVFMLLQREDLRDRVIRLFGSRDLHRTTIAMDDAAIRLSRYFLTQVILSASYGLLTTIFLWAIGVPSPILCGALAAAMRFVPYVGSIIAALFPMALAIAVDPGWSMLVMTAAFFIIGEPAMGYIVEPLVYGQSTGLSPFAVILSTIFWSWLWGPVGLILAMPLTLCLVVLGRHVETFQFLDVILGDTPPLEPPQNFYQRMLAEDPDEALEQAEQYLREHSLTQYYDDVAMRGLNLAARDAGRGVVTSDHLRSIRTSVAALVSDLASTPDAAPNAPERDESESDGENREALPEEWTADGAVLCVAGRGPLDEAASTLLADVLRKNGFGAQVVPYAAVARGRTSDIDMSAAKLACLCYLDLNGAPAHLRYMLRRLRAALPPLPIVAGFWPVDDGVMTDDALQGHIGADHYATTLQDALQASLLEAHVGPEDSQRRAEAIARLDRPLPLP
jgi:predicted PurR-regulated permease PerM